MPPAASVELTMTEAPWTSTVPPPFELNAFRSVGLRTRMPLLLADHFPRATARPRTGRLPCPKTPLNPRAWLYWMMTSTYPDWPTNDPEVGGMLTVTMDFAPSLVWPFAC